MARFANGATAGHIPAVAPITATAMIAEAREHIARTEALIRTQTETRDSATERREAAVDDATAYAAAATEVTAAEIELSRLSRILTRDQAALSGAEHALRLEEFETLKTTAQEQLVTIKTTGETLARRVHSVRVAKADVDRVCDSFTTTRTRIDELAKELGLARPDLPRCGALGLAFAHEQQLLYELPKIEAELAVRQNGGEVSYDWQRTPTAESLVRTLKDVNGLTLAIRYIHVYRLDEQLRDLLDDPKKYSARVRELAAAEAAQIERGRIEHERLRAERLERQETERAAYASVGANA